MSTRTRVAVVESPSNLKLPLWRELFTGFEFLKLRTTGVYYGLNTAKGDKSAVVVVPGFMGTDLYLTELYLWLRRIGYQPYFSRVGHVAQCPDVLLHRLIRTVNRAYRETGRPVHLVGHSFGGVLSRAVASRCPDRVASIITLGSPFGGVRVNPWVMSAIDEVRKRQYKRGRKGKDCLTEGCACGFLCTVRDSFPKAIPHTNIYTKGDGVVDWNGCTEGNVCADVEVHGSHVGLVWNAEVYRVIAEKLASVPQKQATASLVKAQRAAKAAVPVAKGRASKVTKAPRGKQAPAKESRTKKAA